VIGLDGTVYFGSIDRRIYALNGVTGKKKWSFLTGAALTSAPLLTSDGTIYATSDDGGLYALDAMTGTKKWRFFPGTGELRASPALGANSLLFVGSQYGVLYAVESGDTLAQSPWPRFRGNSANTGAANGDLIAVPKFEGLTFGADGSTLKIQASAGQKLIVEMSEDLRKWNAFGSLTATNRTSEFRDEHAAGVRRRFYRLHAEGPPQ